MLITIGLLVLFFAFIVSLALFWWFLTHVLPLIILFYLICAAIRFALALKCGEECDDCRD
jgi:hypothetical protein